MAVEFSLIQHVLNTLRDLAFLEVVLATWTVSLLLQPALDAFPAEKSLALSTALHVFQHILADRADELFHVAFEFISNIFQS